MMPVHLSESHEAGKIADGFKFCHQGPAVHITVVILFADGIAYLFVTDLHNDTREIIGSHLFLLQDSPLGFFRHGIRFLPIIQAFIYIFYIPERGRY